MKSHARAVLALSLLAGVYVLAAGTLLVLGAAVLVGVVLGVGGLLRVAGAAGAVLLLVVAVALGRALWAVRRGRRKEPDGLLLTPEHQPELWAETWWIAATVATSPPDAIRLVPEASAEVWEDARLLGLFAGRRVMTVGAPLVLGLTRQQLRAVLAHELGHYSHRDSALTEVVYRGHVTVAYLVHSLGRATRIGRMLVAYCRLYLRLTRALTRRQELEADAWSHRLAGRAASAQAMRAVAALGPMWDSFLEEYAFAVEGVRPDDLFAGFRDLLSSPQRQQERRELEQSLPEAPPGPHDTHPPLRLRVEHAGSLPDDGIVDDDTPATQLIADLDGVLRQLESDMFSESGLETRPWEWIAATAGARRARNNASLLVRATWEPGSGAATLADALRALAHHESRRLVRPLLAVDMRQAQVDVMATGLVTDAISAALIEHCGARFAVDWDANETLVEPDGQPIDVAGMVSSLVEGKSADWLVKALVKEGVPPSFTVDPSTVDADAPPRGPVAHSVAACTSRSRIRLLVVADQGLIIKRLGLGARLAARILHDDADPYRTAARQVASMPLASLLEDGRATVVDWDRVGPSRSSGSRLALRLDGRRHRLRIRHQTGDLVGLLHHQLGERLELAKPRAPRPSPETATTWSALP